MPSLRGCSNSASSTSSLVDGGAGPDRKEPCARLQTPGASVAGPCLFLLRHRRELHACLHLSGTLAPSANPFPRGSRGPARLRASAPPSPARPSASIPAVQEGPGDTRRVLGRATLQGKLQSRERLCRGGIRAAAGAARGPAAPPPAGGAARAAAAAARAVAAVPREKGLREADLFFRHLPQARAGPAWGSGAGPGPLEAAG